MPRTATTGPAIYEHVTKPLAGGNTKTEAFAEVANERKSSPGTVAANYNRVAPAGRGTEAGCWWPSTTPGFQGGARYLCGAGPDAAMAEPATMTTWPRWPGRSAT